MPKLAQKFTDIVLIGQGRTIDLIKEIISYQSHKTFSHYPSAIPRFVSANTVVVNGEKVSGKKFLIVLPRKKTVRSYAYTGDSLKTADSELHATPPKSACIVGSHQEAIESSIEQASLGVKTTLLSEHETLLPGYDTAVQEVVEKLLKKKSIEVLSNISIVSIDTAGNTVQIVGDAGGTPYRLTAERLIVSPEFSHLNDIGLQNIKDTAEIEMNSILSTVGDDVILVKDSPDIGLASLYDVTEFLLGKTKKNLTYIPRVIYTSEELCYFSIGILEQDYFDTHLSYKKSIAKVSSGNKSLARWFIKVLTSTHNKIIGIHAVLPFNYQNTDLLINLVEKHSDVSELRNSCLVGDTLAEAYVEIIGELS